MAVSLAIALMATALISATTSDRKLADADLSRTVADYALAGAQTRAALGVLSAGVTGRLRWTPTDAAEVLAEPEAAKLDFAHAALLDNGTLAKFGVVDAAHLQTRLTALAGADAADIAQADQAPIWRACARSMISPYGLAPALQLTKALVPVGGGVQWPIGAVWRIRVTLANGWVDDRVVRFTGDPTHPAAVLERRLMRGRPEGEQCDALFASQ